ncbi:MAG: hypothetical protein CSA39_07010 [Flavobacteriales bacterium]|nr:MAG: hypothetical protein CSA39_07010 [Flavobacteriales bacterium]
MILKKKEKQTNNSLGLKAINNKHISIQFSLDGFSFCVFNKENNTVVALRSYSFEESNNSPQRLITNISSLFKTCDALKLNYNTVSVTHSNDLFAFVPKPLFNEKNLHRYVSFNNKVYRHDLVVYDLIEKEEMYSVFIPYVNINNFFIDQFGSFNYKHITANAVEHLMSIYKYSLKPHVFVNVERNHFQLIVISEKKLLLCNSYPYKTKEDFLYYILFAAEQLKLHPETFELVFMGAIDRNSPLFEIAYKYVKNVSMIETRFTCEFNADITESDKREHYLLINQN